MDGLMRTLGYYLATALAIGAVFAAAQTVESRIHGPARVAAGYTVSVGMLLAVAALVRPPTSPVRAAGRRVSLPTLLVVASLLLLFDLFAKKFGAYLNVQRRPPPTLPLIVVTAGWIVLVARMRWRGATPGRLALAMTWLVVGSRVLVLLVCPFDRLPGDMLETIDRSLDLLLAGKFPYVSFPPPMPYLPGMFLVYLPPKLLGFDLRLSNLVLDGATAWLAVRLASGAGDTHRVLREAPVGWVLLPLLMLHPTWVYDGVNTQFSPTLFTTLLLARALSGASPRLQGASLGLAVGCNQMLAAIGPIALIHWLARFGVRRGVAATLAAVAVFLAMIATFLIWDARGFLAIAFAERVHFGPELMAGRLTLLPAAEALISSASGILTLLALVLGALAAWRAPSGLEATGAMAVTLCATLLVQPVSFAHYFLPALVLAAGATPVDEADSSQYAPHAARSRSLESSRCAGSHTAALDDHPELRAT
jgi:hypothetical protein